MSINLSHCYFGFLSLQANLILTERAQFYYPSFPPRSYSVSFSKSLNLSQGGWKNPRDKPVREQKKAFGDFNCPVVIQYGGQEGSIGGGGGSLKESRR